MKETTLKRQVLQYIRRNHPDAFCWKCSDRWVSGIPDIIICMCGKFIAIELKVGYNKPTKIQAVMMERIRDAGGQVAVCYSLKDVKNFLDKEIVLDKIKHV